MSLDIVGVQMPCAIIGAQENSQGGYQNQSSTQSFDDTQAH